MTYTITTIEQVTLNNGKVKKNATLKDPQGAEFKNVTVWPDFLNFVGLAEGMTVEGEIQTKINNVNGKIYTNHTLNSPRTGTNPQGMGKSSYGGIKAAQERKEGAIARAQENKDESIRISSTARDATLIMTAFASKYEHFSDEELQNKWKFWRTWLFTNWDNPVDPNNGVPF